MVVNPMNKQTSCHASRVPIFRVTRHASRVPILRVTRHASRVTIISLLSFLCITVTAVPQSAGTEDQSWRFIGPGATGGRISDIEVDRSNPRNIYACASTGGIFKSGDWGASWVPVFDQAGGSLSIGDIAICDSDPNLIWAGTGEASGEQSAASVGDGVYKSTDGGKSWKCMGLKGTRHISKIQINPLNPDIVYVAATGARWGNNEERGIYRTKDGGKSWEKVLYLNDFTGMGDLVMFPDCKTLLASSWHQYRNAWAHLQRGPSSGLYRSDDGGDTWEKVERGFSKDTIGRTALVVAPSDPKVVYACVESPKGGLYRSDDFGQTWNLMSSKVSTSYWYGRIYVDPKNADHVYVMGMMVQESIDGGKTFKPVRIPGVHVDHHVYWFDPADANVQLLGNDGGFYSTADGGRSWKHHTILLIGQYYAISIDQSEPYRVFGGLQDNGVWGGPSRGAGGGTVSDAEVRSICGGDGFWSAVDPTDSTIAYGESQYGGIVMYDYRTGKDFYIQPQSKDKENPYRFNWNAPFIISTHPPHAIYLGGNKLLKTEDRGGHWTEVSPDISKNENLKTKTIQGMKPVLKPYAAITALAESPIKPGVIYAGTDDGNLQMTKDGGQTWVDLSGKLPMPADRFWTRLFCSVHDIGTVYAACARYYEANDLKPYLFRSTDFGQSWEPISTGMPAEAVVRGFAEDPLNPDHLFCGIHNGLLISYDGGRSWHRAPGLIPVAIDDIKIAAAYGEVVLGSYGRGIIIGNIN